MSPPQTTQKQGIVMGAVIGHRGITPVCVWKRSCGLQRVRPAALIMYSDCVTLTWPLRCSQLIILLSTSTNYCYWLIHYRLFMSPDLHVFSLQRLWQHNESTRSLVRRVRVRKGAICACTQVRWLQSHTNTQRFFFVFFLPTSLFIRAAQLFAVVRFVQIKR